MTLIRCHRVAGKSKILDAPLTMTTYDHAVVRGASLYGADNRRIVASAFFRDYIDGPYFADPGETYSGPTQSGPTKLAPQCFWLGMLVDHFGHFMLSSLARLWAYQTLAQPRPPIAFVGSEGALGLGFVREIFDALEIDVGSLVAVSHGSTLRDVIVAEPAFVENSAAHPEFGRFMRRLGALLAPNPPPMSDVPVYFTKEFLSSGVSRIVNEGELTSRLRKMGWDIIAPERLTRAEQANIWLSRTILASSGGSALHVALLCANKTMISLLPMPYVNSNQIMIDGIGDHSALYLYPQGGMMINEMSPDFQSNFQIRDPASAVAGIVKASKILSRMPIEILPSRCEFSDEPFGQVAPIIDVWRFSSKRLANIKNIRSCKKLIALATQPKVDEKLGEWLQLDFGSEISINEIRSCMPPRNCEQHVTVFGSVNGIIWKKVDQFIVHRDDDLVHRWLPNRLVQVRHLAISWLDGSWRGPSEPEVWAHTTGPFQF